MSLRGAVAAVAVASDEAIPYYGMRKQDIP